MEPFLPARHYTVVDLIKIYWQSGKRFRIYLSFIVIMAMTIAIVGVDLFFNFWFNYFYDALQAYDKRTVIKLLKIFFLAAAFYIALAVYRFYLSQLFGLRWRRWLTNQFIGRWLQKRSYYYLEHFDETTDNPDQRIQDDVGALINYSIDLFIGIVSAVTTFFAFIYVLWRLSGVLTVPLGSFGVLHVHGYLVWITVIYAAFGTYFTLKIGRPLVGLNFEQQRREATFRFSAMDLRAHAEHVALYRGEHHQKSILERLFGSVLDNYYLIIMRQKLLLWYTAFYNQTSVVLPLLVVLPNYFNKVFLLGGLIQSLQAFGRVQESLSFIVSAYTQIAQWRAVGQRLTSFVNHMSDVEEKASHINQVLVKMHAEQSIEIKNLTIETPRQEVLLQHINQTFIHGEHYLIKGASGIGKSTFVRTLAGIWPYASGEVILPSQEKMMYLPQKPYMPIGTLAEAILFPDQEQRVADQVLEHMLRDCRLENLISRLHETAAWSQQLSPGEQQRIAFARILLHQPDWVFLDESSSMLDLANEQYLYQLVQQRLPGISLISVGHRPSLETYHNHILDLTQYSPGV